MSIEVPELPGWLQGNPFQPIFTDEQLVLHEQMIAEVIRTCSVQCTLTFGDCRWVDCTNCNEGLYGPGMTPLNKSNGCSVCNGTNQVSVDEELCLGLMVEYDSSRFERYAGIDLSKIDVQVMTHIEYCPLLVGMKYMTVNNCDGCCDTSRYKITGKPYPCGFGRRKAFVIVNMESI